MMPHSRMLIDFLTDTFRNKKIAFVICYEYTCRQCSQLNGLFILINEYNCKHFTTTQ